MMDKASGWMEPHMTYDTDRSLILTYIKLALYVWLRDEDAIDDWLNECYNELDGRKPSELIATGTQEDLILLKEFIDFVTGLS